MVYRSRQDLWPPDGLRRGVFRQGRRIANPAGHVPDARPTASASPDEKTLYVSETETGRVWHWPIVGEGEVGKVGWPSPNGGAMLGQGTGYQRFDSMAVEAGGNICVGTLVTGGITVFSPEGEKIAYVEGRSLTAPTSASAGRTCRRPMSPPRATASLRHRLAACGLELPSAGLIPPITLRSSRAASGLLRRGRRRMPEDPSRSTRLSFETAPRLRSAPPQDERSAEGRYPRTTQRKPMWLVDESTGWPCRAAGR
ncbi:MAG: SMP-30/gluconolactonase/LRE family protein [Sphingomonadaceae bacterium]